MSGWNSIGEYGGVDALNRIVSPLLGTLIRVIEMGEEKKESPILADFVLSSTLFLFVTVAAFHVTI
jgi:hypothetical protein